VPEKVTREPTAQVVELRPYSPIGCADYEYIEIACMDRYVVDVVTETDTVRGLAVTTETNRNGEFLVLREDNGSRVSVRVDRIVKIIVLTEVRRFDERTFQRS